jgi:hypothetical protein
MDEPNLEVFGQVFLLRVSKERMYRLWKLFKDLRVDSIRIFCANGEDGSDRLTLDLLRGEKETGFHLKIYTGQKIHPVNEVHPIIKVEELKQYLRMLDEKMAREAREKCGLPEPEMPYHYQ